MYSTEHFSTIHIYTLEHNDFKLLWTHGFFSDHTFNLYVSFLVVASTGGFPGCGGVVLISNEPPPSSGRRLIGH